MKLRFTPRATQDLAAIGAYIRERNPQGAAQVRAAILKSVQMPTQYPRAGRAQSVEGVRKIVTRRYSYIFYYSVDEAAQEIVIISVRHPSRQQRSTSVSAARIQRSLRQLHRPCS
jgi:toxin ParE1/3/4